MSDPEREGEREALQDRGLGHHITKKRRNNNRTQYNESAYNRKSIAITKLQKKRTTNGPTTVEWIVG